MKVLGALQMRYILPAASLVLIWFVYLSFHTSAAGSMPSWARISQAKIQVDLLPNQKIVSDDEAAQFCTNHRLEPFDSALRPQRKIYDLLLINTELEMLEIRLGQMSPYVDYFVILESDRTFTDHPKPLHVRENWERFRPWHDKMIVRKLSIEKMGEGAWDRERASRNAMFSQVVPSLSGAQAASQDDVLLVSDVDEIPKPDALRTLRNCVFPARTTLHSQFYYYSFQWLAREDWGHPQATVYRGADGTVLPDDLRKNARDLELRHAAWHCSYCFSSIAELVGKVTSFSHQEFNKPEFKDPEKILQRVRSGTDFFDRKESVFDRVEDNKDVPEYLLQNAEQYKFMLDRDPPNANFLDHK